MTSVYSIEPLTPMQIKLIESLQSVEFIQLDRDRFFDSKYELDKIEILIARDRDDIAGIADACENLKFLFIVSTGVEKLPFPLLRQRKILVANTAGVNSCIMSEYAMAYILANSARVIENYQNQRVQLWKKFQCVDSLEGKRLLIVGAGRTGRLLAMKANAFGMKCVGVKKHIEDIVGFEKVINIEYLDEELPLADYVVCTIPLTPETKGLFNVHRFAKMSERSVFINISRGGLVVEEDLVSALQNGEIKAAVLDVFEKEPLTNESLLWNVKNLYITPHSAGRLENFIDCAISCFVDNLKAYMNNKKLVTLVNLTDGY